MKNKSIADWIANNIFEGYECIPPDMREKFYEARSLEMDRIRECAEFFHGKPISEPIFQEYLDAFYNPKLNFRPTGQNNCTSKK
jgi:hypothetical protein